MPAKLRILFDYTATDAAELSVLEGDIVDVIRQEGEWYMVRYKNKEGFVPGTFVEPA